MDDETIKKQAEEFAKKNGKRIAKEATDPSVYLPDVAPISIFMAGSPGAGKTEYSKNFIDILEKDTNHKVVRIDADELRHHFSAYKGENSYLFQGATSLIVEKIHDEALSNKQTFLFDGTLSNYDRAVRNINRSLGKNRRVYIFYLYQKPEVAWKFTVAREKVEGRNIPKHIFIDQFLQSKEVINRLKAEFGNKISIFLFRKNFETHKVEKIIHFTSDGPQIDDYLEMRYTKDDLEKLL